MLIEAIEKALVLGCGVSLEDALRSERFSELQKQQVAMFDHYPQDSDEGLALRVGHLRMGHLFNTMPEAEALQIARQELGSHSVATENRALVQLLGEYIVQAAQKCLPSEVIEAAQEWRNADVERQIDITKWLYFLFSGRSQRVEQDISWGVFWEDEREYAKHNDGSDANILPAVYGMWDEDSCSANCQGKTQMLTAFGRLAGIKVLSVGSIISAKDVLESWRVDGRKRVRDNIQQRGIKYPDEELLEGLEVSDYQQRFHDMRGQNFHMGAAFQLRDGRWILIDPHGLDWGIFPDSWCMSSIVGMLNKYHEVLPGMNLTGHDHGFSVELGEQTMIEVDRLIEGSQRLEEKLGDEPSLSGLIDALADSSDFEVILDFVGLGDIFKAFAEDEGGRQTLAMMLVGGLDTGAVMAMAMALDKEALQKKIGSFLTLHHCLALNRIRDELFNDAGVLLHPACEFNSPEYDIAIAIINSLGDRKVEADTRFFLDQSFNQVTLRNALTEVALGRDRERNPELAYVAREVVTSLPFMHSETKRTLRYLSHLFRREV